LNEHGKHSISVKALRAGQGRTERSKQGNRAEKVPCDGLWPEFSKRRSNKKKGLSMENRWRSQESRFMMAKSFYPSTDRIVQMGLNRAKSFFSVL
jgi:hypothetical protein